MITDQKPFTVTATHQQSFTGTRRHKKRFGCALCAVEFKQGDVARWVYANGTSGFHAGNFFVCATHDTADVLDRAKESFEQAKQLAKQWGIYGPDWQND